MAIVSPNIKSNTVHKMDKGTAMSIPALRVSVDEVDLRLANLDMAVCIPDTQREKHKPYIGNII